MSIIAGHVDFSGRQTVQANAFSNSFTGFKQDYYQHWQEERVSLHYWHQGIAPHSVQEMQPLIHHELVLVADLRLDNRPELINRLNGVTETATDSELVMAAYRQWHEECVHYLTGGFAFAIWDRHLGTLFCARDHLGQKPLFYHEINDTQGRGVIFCTSPSGILNQSRARKDIDPQGVFNILMGRTCNEDTSTLFAGIKRLAAGFCLLLNNNGIALKRYWQPQVGKSIRYTDDHQYAEAFNEKLEQAVSACIHTHLPVSAFLSGGLDSSTVACMAQKQLQKDHRQLISTSFVLPENEDGIDEKEYIDAILSDHHFDHLYITRENVGFRQCLQETHALYQGYPHTSHVYFNKLLPALAERNVGVHLCGYGGDQVASYHGMWVFEQLLLEGRGGTLLKLLRSTSNGQFSAGLKTLLKTLRNITRAALPQGRNHAWYNKKTARKMMLPALANRPGYREQVLAGPSLDKHSFPWKITDVMKRFLQYDRTSVTLETLSNTFLPYGIEYRTPFTDIRLIDYCMSIPPEQFYLGGKRSLIRRATQGVIPESIRLAHNKHQGSTPHLFHGLWQDKEQLMEDINNCANIRQVSTLLDIPRIRQQLASTGVDEMDKPKVYRNIELALYIAWFKQRFQSSSD